MAIADLIRKYGNRLLVKDKDEAIIELAENGGQGQTQTQTDVVWFYPLSFLKYPIPFSYFKEVDDEHSFVPDSPGSQSGTFYNIIGATSEFLEFNQSRMMTVNEMLSTDIEIFNGLFVAYPDTSFNYFDDLATSLNLTVEYGDLLIKDTIGGHIIGSWSHLYLPVIQDTTLSFIDFGRFSAHGSWSDI